MNLAFYNKYNYAPILKFVSINLDLIFKKSNPLQKFAVFYFDSTSKITHFFLCNNTTFAFICFTGYLLCLFYILELRVFFCLLQEGVGFFPSVKCLGWPLKAYALYVTLLLSLVYINTALVATQTVSLAMKKEYGESILKNRGYDDIFDMLTKFKFFFVVFILVYIAVELTDQQQLFIAYETLVEYQGIQMSFETVKFLKLKQYLRQDFPMKYVEFPPELEEALHPIPLPLPKNLGVSEQIKTLLHEALSETAN